MLDPMDIAVYLNEIEYAASRVVESIWHERDEAERLRGEIDRLRCTTEHDYDRASHIQETSEDADDVMLGVGIHWDTYFGSDKEQFYKTRELEVLEDSLRTREFSVASLSGNLLNYAKQGLSAVYGSPANWPTGRRLGSQDLKTIILEARNQSEHWEEGNPWQKVEACFKALEAEVGSQFGDYKTKNLAFEVVAALGWRSFSNFKNDMLAMQP